MIQHNVLDQFPEYPTINQELGEKFKKIVANVWVKWNEETQQDLIHTFDYMIERENFISQLIRYPRDSQICNQIIRKQMKRILTF